MTENNSISLALCAYCIRENVNPKDYPSVPYIGLEHIEEGSLHASAHGLSGDVDSTKLLFKKGDILFGKLRPYFRKVIRAPFDGICSTDIWVVRAKDGYDQGFIFYWMAGQDFVNFSMAGSEGTKMPRAKWEHASRYTRPVFALTTQERIADILGSLDDKIELNRQMNATLEDMARAIFKSWFVDFDPVYAKMEGCDYPLPAEVMGLFPNEMVESELGLIPRGWEVGTVGQAYEFAYGKSLPKKTRIAGEYPVYGSNGIVGTHNEKLVNAPGIVVGRKGNPGFVTWAANDFYPIDTTFYIKTELPMLFAFYQLDSLALSRLSADSAVPGLNRNIAYMEEISLPEEKVINAFEQIALPLYKKIGLNNEEIKTLSNIRDTLLPNLMNGDIRI